MSQLILKSELKNENDIVWVRRKARELALQLKLSKLEQIQLATAVSEITRNAYQYAGGGTAYFSIERSHETVWLSIKVKDQGKGIKNLKEILSGSYVSPQGMGVGIIGSKKLVDDLQIHTSATGTTVNLRKVIPSRKTLLSIEEIRLFSDYLLSPRSQDPIEEIQSKNDEIALTIKELHEKKEELSRLNQELEDTNRGVVALYAELDEKAESLRLANESKTSFLSDMTHEFRSPLNSILSISQILLEDAQEAKNEDLQKQVQFIMKAAVGLSTLVNDLLDIAKIEAGKISVRVEDFCVLDIISALRGLMKPFGGNDENVELIFEESPPVQILSDEGKLTQILRNLISNALKYTESGSVRVSLSETPHSITFFVKDTGIGIPRDQIENIFSEFVQIEGPLQKKNKGTGLGLPLTKKLVKLLGGEIQVKSEVGKGSVFSFTIPKTYLGPQDAQYTNIRPALSSTPVINGLSSSKKRVLIADDDESTRYSLAQVFENHAYLCSLVENGRDALMRLAEFKPDFMVLDLSMPHLDGIGFLKEKMQIHGFQDLPIIIYTSQDLDPELKSYLSQFSYKIFSKEQGPLNLVKEVDHYFERYQYER